jgi:DNA-binding transcriptional LysR family regulator
MNEQMWQTFKAVSERQSISGAARFLNLSQSAVSQHIHQLESEYQTALFIRTSQGVKLTEVGEVVYRHVVNLLTTLEESRQRVAEYLRVKPSNLAIGASLTVAEYVLPHVLTQIDNARDRQDITVHMANSHEVLDRVVHRDLDIGLIEAPISSPHLVYRPFLEDHLRVVVSRDHDWANRDRVTMDELASAPLLIREPGSGTRMVLEEALGRVGISLNQLNIRFVLATTQAIKAMIEQKMGVSVLSPLTILPYERSRFHMLSVDEVSFARSLALIYPHDLTHPVARKLIRGLFNLDGRE